MPQSTWDKLAQKKIFFGHHSVGNNILQGLTLILEEHQNIKLNILLTKNVGKIITKPALVHGGVGKNFYPYTKIDGFREQIEAGYGDSTDIAFFKFCFVDFNPETDIKDVFDKYSATMNYLIKKYPNTTFAVVTTPLTCYAPGLSGLEKRVKDIIKKIIGKVNQYDHSSANRFNELLLATYENELPIFDLAKHESTNPDGSRRVVKKGGIVNFELVPTYTTDGGHLNEKGQRILGEKFLLFLAELAEQSK
ncbi:hypothetical protein GF1_00680 [Desulfolithobacter dissulfuricans]|uniref:Uncharacterized protein n=1 Tax=Desulfolithobacter dissulfuricans TaxID=2795293 RepID=A0A915XIK6_9BACT|nr:hypothetical protein GF1_00680 [Desulfolithobacter dissulfuricans]